MAQRRMWKYLTLRGIIVVERGGESVTEVEHPDHIKDKLLNLDQMDERGWELVSTVYQKPSDVNKDTDLFCIFRRPFYPGGEQEV